MKDERDKLVKVLDELINFCFTLDMHDLKIDFKINNEYGEVTLEGPCESPPLDQFQQLEDAFNATRQPEFEEYYWPLIGGDHSYPQIELLGTFIDEGSIIFEDNYLKIYILRKK